MAHNKNLNPLLNLLINFKSAKSAPQILSLNDEYTAFFQGRMQGAATAANVVSRNGSH